jgi:hypothetical protein
MTTLNLTDDEVHAVLQLQRSIKAGRSSIPAPLRSALAPVWAKLREVDDSDVPDSDVTDGVWDPPATIDCAVCGETVEVKPGWGYVPKYCSLRCQMTGWKAANP